VSRALLSSVQSPASGLELLDRPGVLADEPT
jgi:hypothetical protein